MSAPAADRLRQMLADRATEGLDARDWPELERLIDRAIGKVESELAGYVRPVEGGLRLTRSLASSGASRST